MQDARWMQSALGLARRSQGRTRPNPTVGAIIVKGNRVLGSGTTADGGRPHAEAVALKQATDRYGADAIRGAEMFVTLEPCAHQGQTPPCVDALIAAGISRVVCPLPDPDPRVAGRGLDKLRAAGITVDVGLMADEARVVNAGFLSRVERGRPWLVLKLASTVDGRIATASGESRWITGAPARRRVHLMRARSDAILIGAGTARADNPSLDVRDLGLGAMKPVRIVADGGLSLSLTSKLAQTARDQPVWLLHRQGVAPARADAMQGVGIELLPTKAGDSGELDMTDALTRLGTQGITRVLCEGGGRLAASLIAEDLVDELVHMKAGKVIGGDGRAVVQGIGLTALADAPEFRLESLEHLGGDAVATYLRR